MLLLLFGFYDLSRLFQSLGGAKTGDLEETSIVAQRATIAHLRASMSLYLLQICEKLFTIPTRILSMMMCIQNLVSFCQFVLKILSKNQILTSIKGSNSVANLRKTKIYNTNIDLVNDNVYTKFGLNLFILSQDIEQKPNSDINQER